MPGGADLPYCQYLNGQGNQKIADFVAKGGGYLGICAGAYYAGNFVEFAEGTEMEVVGARELSFFPGIVRGPMLAPYDYATNSGCRAAKVKWCGDATFYTTYFNGGGYFVDAGRNPNVTVLANYCEGNDLPAIIECKVRSGKAILSGVHIEYDPFQLDATDPYYALIIPTLSEADEQRRELFARLLGRLLN